MNGTVISGTGAAVPAIKKKSSSFDEQLGKSSGWLFKRTGVKSRYVCVDESQEQLAVSAAQKALADAGLTIKDIGLVLFGAAVGRQPIPATAPLILKLLDDSGHIAAAFDVNATCLSALQAMDIADLWIKNKRCEHVLVISSEIPSRALPWENQPEIAGLFGDGAAAVVLSASEYKNVGIQKFMLETYPQGYDACQLPAGGTRFDFHNEYETFAARSFFEMNGKLLYKITADVMPGFIDRLLETTGWSKEDVDLVVPHQASSGALIHLSRRCGFSQEKIINIIANVGNQVAASLPTALEKAFQMGRITPGTKVLMIGTSAGISLGGMTYLA